MGDWTGWASNICLCVGSSLRGGEKHQNKIPRKYLDNPVIFLLMCFSFVFLLFPMLPQNGQKLLSRRQKAAQKTGQIRFNLFYVRADRDTDEFDLFLADAETAVVGLPQRGRPQLDHLQNLLPFVFPFFWLLICSYVHSRSFLPSLLVALFRPHSFLQSRVGRDFGVS